MSVRHAIVRTFEEVASEQRRQIAPLTDGLNLLESGMDPLGFALIVARLEDALGCDPFETAGRFPVAFGEFVRMYENSLA